MPDAQTPLRFFGQREGIESAYGPFLRSGGKYRRVYDPFCGSASVTAFARRNGLADEYVFSDVDRPLMGFWALVKALPELVIARYQELAEALAALPSETERAAAFDARVAFDPSRLPARVKRFDPSAHSSNARIVEDLLRSAEPRAV